MKVNMIIALNSQPIRLKNNLKNFAALLQKVRNNVIRCLGKYSAALNLLFPQWFSPTRPTEREGEKPWKTPVTCLPESGGLQTNNLGEGQVSVRFVSTERRQVNAAMKLCT